MIRKLKPTELSSVMQIWLDANLEAHQFINPLFWHKNADNVRKLMGTAEIYVYETEDDHKVVGFIGLINNLIGGLFVHNAYRATGVGKKLIDYAKLSKAYLIVHVYKQNELAYHFYRREGFNLSREQIEPNTMEMEYEMFWEK